MLDKINVPTLENSLLSLCRETTTELPKSTNVTCSVFHTNEGCIVEKCVELNRERKSLAYPDNSASYHLLQPGPIPKTIHILYTELRCLFFPDIGNFAYGLKLCLEYLDSTRGARPVGSQTPHLLAFPHPISFHKLVLSLIHISEPTRPY